MSSNMRNHTFGHALKEDSDQPEHQLSDQSDVCMKKICILGYPEYAQWKFRSDFVNAQADLKNPLQNMPIQIYWKFHHQKLTPKTESFQIKILILFIFQN